MTEQMAPPGWYPDPWGYGNFRWFDGQMWTGHFAPGQQPGMVWTLRHPYKGADLGLPPVGPGALANPGRRLGARALDALVMLPVFATLATIAIVLVAPHAGPMFPNPPAPDTNEYGNVNTPTPGFVWIYLAVLGASAATGLVAVIYEAVATARYGRTLGKAWMKIRPVRCDGTPLGFWRSLGRIAVFWASGLLNWIGLLDPLWCLWDANQQCLHDKVVDTVVVNDWPKRQLPSPAPP